MVNKIFKAASDNDQTALNSLLDQVEDRAREMVKPKDLPDHPGRKLTKPISQLTKHSNPDEVELSRSQINSRTGVRNNSDLGASAIKGQVPAGGRKTPGSEHGPLGVTFSKNDDEEDISNNEIDLSQDLPDKY